MLLQYVLVDFDLVGGMEKVNGSSSCLSTLQVEKRLTTRRKMRPPILLWGEKLKFVCEP